MGDLSSVFIPEVEGEIFLLLPQGGAVFLACRIIMVLYIIVFAFNLIKLCNKSSFFMKDLKMCLNVCFTYF